LTGLDRAALEESVMSERYVVATLAETVLSIECPHCGSAYVVAPRAPAEIPAVFACFACGKRFDERNVTPTVASLYRQMCEEASACGATVRLHVPAA